MRSSAGPLLIAIGALGMVVAAYRPQWRRPLAWFIGGHFVVLSFICLILSYVWFDSAWGLLQWTMFLSLGALTIWAAGQGSGAG